MIINKKVNTRFELSTLVKDYFNKGEILSWEKENPGFEELFYREDFKKFTANLNGFFLLFNYRTTLYEYVSDSITLHLGFSAKDFTGIDGTPNVYSLIHKSHIGLFIDPIFKEVLEYLSGNVTKETGLDYRFNCSLKLRNIDNEYKWYILDTVVIQTEPTGLPWRTLVTITNIDQYKKDDLLYYNVLKKDERGMYKLVFEKHVLQDQVDYLTGREKEILYLIANGFANKQIAEKLFISETTVKAHRRSLISKTKCKGVAELTNYAFSRGFV